MTNLFHKHLKVRLLRNWTFLFLSAFLCVICTNQAFSDVLITEFVAENDESYLDEDGDAEDWIEIYNNSSTSVDLSGWSLTDDAADLTKWIFPPGTSLGAGEYRVIFASGKNPAGDRSDFPYQLFFKKRRRISGFGAGRWGHGGTQLQRPISAAIPGHVVWPGPICQCNAGDRFRCIRSSRGAHKCF